MTSAEFDDARIARPSGCPACGAAVAHDQRYCVECGTRQGPLPAQIEAILADISDPGHTPVPFLAPAAGGEPDGPRLPAPSAASFAVMAMLAFGVVVGSLTGRGGVESLADTLVLALPSLTHAGAPVPTTTLASVGSGTGSSPRPSTAPAAASSSSSTTTTTAATPAQTVTTASTTTSATSTNPSTDLLNLPPVKHVFLIVLSDQGFSQSFATTAADPYLSRTLRAQGELINDYYAVAGSPLANEIALVSGQGPTPQTAADCPVFTAVSATGTGRLGQVLGQGCVYPAATPTLANQLSTAGLRWRAYVQGVGNGGPGQPVTCRHPALGATDADQSATATDPYTTWSNPFVYFRSLAAGGRCVRDDVAVGRLATDLERAATTPAVSYIAADPCDDGSDQPCTAGAAAGLRPADRFLRSVVPEIEASAAYKQDGLIAITFAEAPQTGPNADTSSCCDQPAFPNLPGAAGTGTTTTGTTTSAGTTTSGAPTTTGTDTTTTGTDTTTTGTDTTTTSGADTTTSTDTAAATTSATDTTTTGTTPASDTTTSTTSPAAPAATTTTAATTTSPACTTTTATTTTGPTPTTTGATGTSTTTATTTTPCTTSTSTSAGNPPGGGQVGLLLISRYVKAGSSDVIDTYNHFSLLKTIEDFFSLKPLGYAADPSLPVLDAAVFNAAGK